MRSFLFTGATLLAIGPLLGAQTAADEGSTVTLELVDGSTITGTLLTAGETELVVQSTSLGEVTIPRLQLAIPEPAPEEADVELELSPWSGSFDAMLSGSGGNTDTELFRSSLNLRRKDEDVVDTYTFIYELARTDGTKQKDNFFAKARREFDIEDSEWRAFFQGTAELDEFKDWTYRVAAHAGVARPLIDEDDEELSVRLGAGFSKEVGSDDDEVKPEGLVGASYRKELTETSTFTAEVDVYPELDDLGEWRAVAGAFYEALLTDEPDDSPWTFKSGVSTNYDSTPGDDFKKADYAYYAGVGVIF